MLGPTAATMNDNLGNPPLADKLRLVCDALVRVFEAGFARVWVVHGPTVGNDDRHE